MYPRRLPNPILPSQSNLKKFFLENTNILYRTLRDIKSAKSASTRLQLFIKNNFSTLLSSHKSIKDQSASLLKLWAHQCEFVVAQRIRRSQQMFCMYSRMWEERNFKELLRNMRMALSRRRKVFLGAVGVSTFNWNEKRISDEEMKQYMTDIDYINKLKNATICMSCDPTNRNNDSKQTVCGHCNSGLLDGSRKYDNWEPFLLKEDLVVWRKQHESGSYIYKVFGSYPDVTATDFLNVQVDTEYRKKWDSTAVALETIENDPKEEMHSDIIYWEMLWPRLFTNRDYVFLRRYMIHNESNTMVILSKSTVHPKYPKRSDKYRVEDYWSRMVIKPYGEMDQPGVEFSLTYYDNPGVNIPSSVTNWVAMRAMPDFLARLREATKNYKNYCIVEGVSAMCKIVKQRVPDDDFLDFCSFTHEPVFIRPKVPKPATSPKADESKENVQETEETQETQEKIDTSPAPSSEVQQPTNSTVKADNSFWKYLRPTYYFH